MRDAMSSARRSGCAPCRREGPHQREAAQRLLHDVDITRSILKHNVTLSMARESPSLFQLERLVTARNGTTLLCLTWFRRIENKSAIGSIINDELHALLCEPQKSQRNYVLCGCTKCGPEVQDLKTELLCNCLKSFVFGAPSRLSARATSRRPLPLQAHFDWTRTGMKPLRPRRIVQISMSLNPRLSSIFLH